MKWSLSINILKHLRIISVLLILMSSSYMALTESDYQMLRYNTPKVYLVDDFSDGNLTANPSWWGFGKLNVNIVPNPTQEYLHLGEKSLEFRGETKNWYVGGIGTYVGLDMGRYNALKLLVWGSGPDSGTLMFEMYDDDNNNWEIELNPASPSTPLADDKFRYDLRVDWTGWRIKIIPLSFFRDDNPNIGDGEFNPFQINGSGGLLQFQIIVLGNTQDANTHIRIDSIKFYKETDKRIVPALPKTEELTGK